MTIRMPRRCPCHGQRCSLLAVDDRHGTENGYSSRGCRCGDCRRAHREAVWERIERRADAGVTCPNCGGAPGRYADGTCEPCARHLSKYGRPRPPWPGRLCDMPRHCDNCGKRMLPGCGRRRGRCEACARYWTRNDVERPPELWRPLEADAADDDHLADDQAVAS